MTGGASAIARWMLIICYLSLLLRYYFTRLTRTQWVQLADIDTNASSKKNQFIYCHCYCKHSCNLAIKCDSFAIQLFCCFALTLCVAAGAHHSCYLLTKMCKCLFLFILNDRFAFLSWNICRFEFDMCSTIFVIFIIQSSFCHKFEHNTLVR